MAYELLKTSTPGKTDILKTVTVADGVTSDWVIFPAGVEQVSITVNPGTTAKIQYTNDIEGVIAGTATGIDWDDGDVSVATGRVSNGIKVFRLVSLVGEATAHFRGVFG